MRKEPFLVAVALLVCVAALAQKLCIISFDPNGELSWTNSFAKGFYNVESANLPSGPWNLLSTVADLVPSVTNRITASVPLTNAQAFYRVAWLRPDPIGVWDYQGYDSQGELVITGHLSIASMRLISSNPPVVYGVQGSWELQYAGPPTNKLWWLGPQIGTGFLTGTMELNNSKMNLYWPTNCIDCSVQLLETALGPKTYTGIWYYWTWVEGFGGPFSAERP